MLTSSADLIFANLTWRDNHVELSLYLILWTDLVLTVTHLLPVPITERDGFELLVVKFLHKIHSVL